MKQKDCRIGATVHGVRIDFRFWGDTDPETRVKILETMLEWEKAVAEGKAKPLDFGDLKWKETIDLSKLTVID